MKNVSNLKSNATNSPKTPGGISKSLLTPCRRVGLSRNWRNKGPSPFISPLSGHTPAVKEEKIETRKRKERNLDDNVEVNPETCSVDQIETEGNQTSDIDKTPSRNVEVPRRKKSKTLLAAINKSQEDIITDSVVTNKNNTIAIEEDASEEVDHQNIENVQVVSTPVRTKSKKSKKRSPKLKSNAKDNKPESNKPSNMCNDENIDTPDQNPKESTETYEIKEKSPNDLRKECIVVIQRKIFKKTEKEAKTEKIVGNEPKTKDKNEKSSSQVLFDSDSDEVPLIQLNNKNVEEKIVPKQTTNKTEDSNDDDDFIDKSTKINKTKVKDTKSPKNKLKTNKSKVKKVEKVNLQPKPSSQSSYDDDDDDFDNKKTILIRRTYSKPVKAKSTGSITQKDIDELKARIEAKKKLLLAKAINPDTEELRTLIKKWQKGCQDALMELLDLMKTKFNDKQDMDYAEMLNTLKIPPALVGYDAENDCFKTPDDASVILGQFEDI